MSEANKLKVVGVIPADPAEEIPVSIAALPASEVDVTKIGGTAQTGRDVTQDLRALVDDAIKGVMRTLGDAGIGAANEDGETVLKRLVNISSNLTDILEREIKQVNGTTQTARDWSLDFKALRDNSVTGILKSLETYLRSINGDTGTQITKSAERTSTGITIIHTVTAGKTLYLSTVTLGAGMHTSGNQPILKVRDASDVDQYNILKSRCTATGSDIIISAPFPTPIKIPAGYDVCIESINDAYLYGFIHGWEE